MTLFFEPEFQGISFLFLCAVGFVLALLFDLISVLVPPRMRPLGDVLLFLLFGFAVLLAFVFLRVGQLRLFYWVALLAGAVLYLCGVRKLVVAGGGWVKKKFKTKQTEKIE